MGIQEKIENKMSEAVDILNSLGLKIGPKNKVAPLTLLALCQIKPEDSWENASRESLIISKHIMPFAEKHYGIEYKANSRESFRKDALHEFVGNNIAELNPDDPSLAPTSSKTHYAITTICLNTVRKYRQPDWEVAVENFKKFNQSQLASKEVKAVLRKMHIEGFKSIGKDSIELGRVNVFIGANGSGKTNVLEAIAMAGAARANDLNLEGLYSRGVRVSRPDQIISSFVDSSQRSSVEFKLNFDDAGELFTYDFSLTPAHQQDIYTRWIDLAEEQLYPEYLLEHIQEVTLANPGISGQKILDEVNVLIREKGLRRGEKYDQLLTEYLIYDLNTKSLRGINPGGSKKTPLGINGEGLDVFITSMANKEKQDLYQAKLFFDWLGEIITDKDDRLKLQGLKAGKSISTLYFKDVYMQEKKNTLSAENSNEGILHILFYLALFTSDKTPRLIAIDNIETALNPRLCETLMQKIVELCYRMQKQVLITTHNPAILDGLNLLDDEQRLFEVYRNDEGHTKTRRIKFKSDLSNKKEYRLSEMWMSGLLGAVPRNF